MSHPELNPLLFTFTLDSTTKDHVDVRALFDRASRDANLGPNLEVIDRNDVCTWFAEHPTHPDASKMKAALPGILDGTAVDGALVATAIYQKLASLEAEYHTQRREDDERIQEEEEIRRERVRELMDEGLKEEDAEAQIPPVLSPEEVEAMEAPRPPLFVALREFPQTYSHVEAMYSAGLPLHLVECINSKVPLERKEVAPAPVDPKAKPGGKASKPEPKKAEPKKAGGKDAKGKDEAAPVVVDPLSIAVQKELQALQALATQSPVRNTLVVVHDVPADESESKDGTRRFVMTVTEDSFREGLFNHIVAMQQRNVQYSEWRGAVRVIDVPTLSVMAPHVEFVPIEPRPDEKKEDEAPQKPPAKGAKKAATTPGDKKRKEEEVEEKKPTVVAREIPCPTKVTAIPTTMDIMNAISGALPPNTLGVAPVLTGLTLQAASNLQRKFFQSTASAGRSPRSPLLSSSMSAMTGLNASSPMAAAGVSVIPNSKSKDDHNDPEPLTPDEARDLVASYLKLAFAGSTPFPMSRPGTSLGTLGAHAEMLHAADPCLTSYASVMCKELEHYIDNASTDVLTRNAAETSLANVMKHAAVDLEALKTADPVCFVDVMPAHAAANRVGELAVWGDVAAKSRASDKVLIGRLGTTEENWQKMQADFSGMVYFPEWVRTVEEYEAALAPPPSKDDDDVDDVPAPEQPEEEDEEEEEEEFEEGEDGAVRKPPPPPPQTIINQIDLEVIETAQRMHSATLHRKKQMCEAVPPQLLHVHVQKNVLNALDQGETVVATKGGAVIKTTVFQSNTNATRCTIYNHGDVFGFHANHNGIPHVAATPSLTTNSVYLSATLQDMSSFIVSSHVVGEEVRIRCSASTVEGCTAQLDHTRELVFVHSQKIIHRVAVYSPGSDGIVEEHVEELHRRVLDRGIVAVSMTNGGTIFLFPNGNVSSYVNGTWVITKNDGCRVVKRPDGTRLDMPRCLCCTRAFHSHGSTAEMREDGVRIDTLIDGVKVVTHSDGTRFEIFDLDGVTRISSELFPAVEWHADSTRILMPNGTVLKASGTHVAAASTTGLSIVSCPNTKRIVVTSRSQTFTFDPLFGGMMTVDSDGTSVLVTSRGRVRRTVAGDTGPAPPPPIQPRSKRASPIVTEYVLAMDEPVDALFAGQLSALGFGQDDSLEKVPETVTPPMSWGDIRLSVIVPPPVLPKFRNALSDTTTHIAALTADVAPNAEGLAVPTKMCSLGETCWETVCVDELRAFLTAAQTDADEGRCVVRTMEMGGVAQLYTFVFAPQYPTSTNILATTAPLLPPDSDLLQRGKSINKGPSTSRTTLAGLMNDDLARRHVKTSHCPARDVIVFRQVIRFSAPTNPRDIQQFIEPVLLREAIVDTLREYERLRSVAPPVGARSPVHRAPRVVKEVTPCPRPLADLQAEIMTASPTRACFWETAHGSKLVPKLEEERKDFVAKMPKRPAAPERVQPEDAEEPSNVPATNDDDQCGDAEKAMQEDEPVARDEDDVKNHDNEPTGVDVHSAASPLQHRTTVSKSPFRQRKPAAAPDLAPSSLDVKYQCRELPARRNVALASNSAYQQLRHEQLETIRSGGDLEKLAGLLQRHDPMKMVATPSAINFGVVVVGYRYEHTCTLRNVGQIASRFTAVLRNTSVPDLPRMLSVSYTKGPLAGGMTTTLRLTLNVLRHVDTELSAELSIRTESMQIKLPITARSVEPSNATISTQLRQTHAKLLGMVTVAATYHERERVVPGEFQDLDPDSDDEQLN